MVTKHIRALLPFLALTGLLAGLSSCGEPPSSSKVRTTNAPDRVHIAIHVLDPQVKQPVVTLTDVSLVRQLYTTVVALPPLPQNSVCTMELGQSYTLTFLQGGKTLTTVTAQRYGCGHIALTGEKQDREANQEFWLQLDQAIFQAPPDARPEQLALLHTLQLNQLPQTAQITSVEMVQRLYNAILALPQAHAHQYGSCAPESFHEYAYQLVFHTADQAIPSGIDNTCNTISLEGNYRSRGGIFLMTSQFKHLFKQTLAAATFVPAYPDRLTLALETVKGFTWQRTIADARLRQQLYTKLFALPMGKVQPNCPSAEEKVSGKGKWYILSFTQWDLPVLVNVNAYEGSCTFVSLDGSMGQVLQGDRAFWALVHQASH